MRSVNSNSEDEEVVASSSSSSAESLREEQDSMDSQFSSFFISSNPIEIKIDMEIRCVFEP